LEYKVGRSNDSIVIQGHVKPPTIVSKSKVTEKEKFFIGLGNCRFIFVIEEGKMPCKVVLTFEPVDKILKINVTTSSMKAISGSFLSTSVACYLLCRTKWF